ncbi:MAG TPA: hypothetical protein VK817_25295 [Trebonia sp.]|nr:hypothetical protein [Trebonia sp.]
MTSPMMGGENDAQVLLRRQHGVIVGIRRAFPDERDVEVARLQRAELRRARVVLAGR